MRRRAIIALLGGAAAWPLVARAQQGERMRRIGVLMVAHYANDAVAQARNAAFLQGLQEAGWAVGRNVADRGALDTRAGHYCYRWQRVRDSRAANNAHAANRLRGEFSVANGVLRTSMGERPSLRPVRMTLCGIDAWSAHPQRAKFFIGSVAIAARGRML
jgi:hypothetical protein